MKLHLLASFLLLAATLGAQAQNYTLRTLTFEDADFKGSAEDQCTGVANWSSLIDDPQYGGKLLYGESGMGDSENFYYWNDNGNTMLQGGLVNNWGSYCYWGGGEAISHYVSADFETYGNYRYQLTVYKKGVTGMGTTAGGHNGSNNFAVHYGYSDNSGYSATNLSELSFSDGEARVIDHMYINNLCYDMSCFVSGNQLTPQLGDNDFVSVTIIGYDADGEKTDSVVTYLGKGADVISDWTKVDLSSLGEVSKIAFNVGGSSDNGYGFSQPAYFAYDDIAVRFPSSITGVTDAAAARQVASVTYFNLAGQQSAKPFAGVNLVRTTYTDGTTATAKVLK